MSTFGYTRRKFLKTLSLAQVRQVEKFSRDF